MVASADGFGNSKASRFKEPSLRNQELAKLAGPADTVVSKRSLEFTRIRSTPAISFASPTDTELFRSRSSASVHGLVGLLHPARTPGPGTYKPKNIGLEGNAGTCVQKKHTYAFSFGNTGRFLSHDTNQKSPAPNHYKYSQNCISTGIGW